MSNVSCRLRNQASLVITMATALALLTTGPAHAQGAKPLTKCAPDAVIAGTVCIDKYEASVWRIVGAKTINKGLVKKVVQGKATLADLAKGGAVRLGVGSDDYAPCADSGQNCADDIYALSMTGVTPSTRATWFQAQAACANARKRLPSNAEWQVAVIGTPDPGPDNGTTDCNTTSTTLALPEDPVIAGSRTSCVSTWGAFDMVGNLDEWVADWIPRSVACGTWRPEVSATNDAQCLAGVGADSFGEEPGGLLRGGDYYPQFAPGPLAVIGTTPVAFGSDSIGFRCAR